MLKIVENVLKYDENRTILEILDISKRIGTYEIHLKDDLIKELRSLINDGIISDENFGHIIECLKSFGQIFLNIFLDVNYFENIKYRITLLSRVKRVIPKWKEHLVKTGYKEDGLFLVLNKVQYNRDECLNVVCRTSVYIKELCEIIDIYAKNKSNVFDFKDAAQLRYDYFEINLLSTEALKEKIKCHICYNKIDFDNWRCTMCDESQEYNRFIIKYHDILESKLGWPRTFSRRTSEQLEQEEEYNDDNDVEYTYEQRILDDPNKWYCGLCTYLNTSDKLNCDICGQKR